MSYRVDPFAEDSPVKKISIDTFPPDVFFVLRVTQMLRGLAGGMGVKDFSNVVQWRPYAEAAVRGGARLRGGVAPDSELALPPAPAGLESIVGEDGGGDSGEVVVVEAVEKAVENAAAPALPLKVEEDEEDEARRRRQRRRRREVLLV
jgi:hypothetical protein